MRQLFKCSGINLIDVMGCFCSCWVSLYLWCIEANYRVGSVFEVEEVLIQNWALFVDKFTKQSAKAIDVVDIYEY